jgi:hypothetical protein
MNMFDILKDILTIKAGDLHLEDNFEQVFSRYMITRYLSMDSKLIEIAEVCNLLQTTWSNKQMYTFLVNTVPRRKNPYIKYISKPKQKEEDEETS